MLKLENCRERKTLLLKLMEREELDLAVLSNPKTVYYFSGVLPQPQLPHAFLLNSSGKSVLVTHAPMDPGAPPPISTADQIELYDWHRIERDVSHTTWDEDAAGLVRAAVQRLLAAGGRVGIEPEFASYGVGHAVQEAAGQAPQSLTPHLDQMRRQKDPDEVECIRKTAALVQAGLGALKERLEAGMTEYKAYLIYYEAMVAKAETSVALKGDFACGTRAIRGGGPPTSRRVQLGELYIIDSSPTYQGYMCDFTRTFVVGRPSQLQQDAWGHVMEAHDIARKTIHPGVPAKEVYHAIKNHLDKFAPAKGSFWHHAGHGLGMSGWEMPWLTPGSEHVIQDREVLACEPALYAEEMQGGIRLEHDYLVTPEGAIALDHFPMELT